MLIHKIYNSNNIYFKNIKNYVQTTPLQAYKPEETEEINSEKKTKILKEGQMALISAKKIKTQSKAIFQESLKVQENAQNIQEQFKEKLSTVRELAQKGKENNYSKIYNTKDKLMTSFEYKKGSRLVVKELDFENRLLRKTTLGDFVDKESEMEEIDLLTGKTNKYIFDSQNGELFLCLMGCTKTDLGTLIDERYKFSNKKLINYKNGTKVSYKNSTTTQKEFNFETGNCIYSENIWYSHVMLKKTADKCIIFDNNGEISTCRENILSYTHGNHYEGKKYYYHNAKLARYLEGVQVKGKYGDIVAKKFDFINEKLKIYEENIMILNNQPKSSVGLSVNFN